MLKLLLAQTTRSSSGSVARYFLDFADEVEADVTVLRPHLSDEKPATRRSSLQPPWLSMRFLPSGRLGCARQAVKSSRLFSYDLILTGSENERGRFWNNPAAHLSRKAWAPVMLIPGTASFRPFQNVLFTDKQLFASEPPLLGKLAGSWQPKRFLYPLNRKSHSIGSYHARRFDETGYSAVPWLNINHLRQYVRRHEIGLIVARQSKNKIDGQALNKLPVPTLIYNSRNIPASQARNQPMLQTAAASSWPCGT